MPKVFIPQLPTRFDKATGKRVPTIDTNPASVWGEVVVVYSDEVSVDIAISSVKAEGVADIGRDDYIMAVGDIALLVNIVIAALGQNGRARLLRWQNNSNSYYVQEV